MNIITYFKYFFFFSFPKVKCNLHICTFNFLKNILWSQGKAVTLRHIKYCVYSMDNKIVSTTYVPLQPPYQIIKYSGDIAMQIGTLIVTIQKEGNANGMGYQIETHSHPVVAYENKELVEPNRQLVMHQFLEGAVWDYVEVKDVTTICLSNSCLSWKEFIDFLWRDLDKGASHFPNVKAPPSAVPPINAFWSIEKLCKGVEYPNPKEYIVTLRTVFDNPLNQTPLCVTSQLGEIMALRCPAGSEEEVLNELTKQVKQYMDILYILNPPVPRPNLHKYPITFNTKEKGLLPIVEYLNEGGIPPRLYSTLNSDHPL